MPNNFPIDSCNTLNNRYQPVKILGDSGKRITLMARDLNTKDVVVIKILMFNDEFCWEDLKLFEREAQTLQYLSHPAIPKYIDSFDLDIPNFQGFALVQNYIQAPSLQEHLETARQFSEKEIKQLAESLLKVLNYLHLRQPAVIHRDIKPSNILLANRSAHSVGDVYLVDFGSVQTTVKEYGTRTVVGTYGYMPPEQFGGRVFPASDLYSLGATLVYLITKKHPVELIDDNLQIQIPPTNNFSSEFINWLKLMTQPSFKRRLNSASVALQALANISEILAYDNSFHQSINSKIKIRRTVKQVEIILPLQVQTSNFLVFCVLFFTTLVSFIRTSQLILMTPVLFILFVFALIITIKKIQELFAEKRILVNKNSINIIDALFGIDLLTFTRTEISVQHNLKLLSTATKSSYKLLKLDEKVERITLPPNLIICTGNKEYELSSILNKKLTMAEQEFIAQEISNYFNTPIVDIQIEQ